MIVDALLVTYRRTTSLVESCRAALEQDGEVRSLIVVDNGGEDLAESVLSEAGLLSGGRVEAIAASENVGPTGGFNLGLERVRSRSDQPDWLLLLDDDDPLVNPSIVSGLIGEAEAGGGERLGGIGLLGDRFFAPLLLPRRPAADRSTRLTPVDCLFGNHAPLYRPRALYSVGGFRPELFWGHEELDLGLRLRRANWELAWASSLYHSLPRAAKDGERTGKPRFRLDPPSASRYYVFRNTIYIGRSYPKPFLVLAIAVRGVLKPLLGFLRQPRLALANLRQNLRASRDALTGAMGRSAPLEGHDGVE